MAVPGIRAGQAGPEGAILCPGGLQRVEEPGLAPGVLRRAGEEGLGAAMGF